MTVLALLALSAALTYLAWNLGRLNTTPDPDSDCSVGCYVCGWQVDVPPEFVSAAVQVHVDTCPGMEHDE